MVGSFVRFLLLTRGEGSLNSLVQAGSESNPRPSNQITVVSMRPDRGRLWDFPLFFSPRIVSYFKFCFISTAFRPACSVKMDA